MNSEVLAELRQFAKENNLEISSLLTEAVEDLLLKSEQDLHSKKLVILLLNSLTMP